MTKKELEKLINKLINDKVPNDVRSILLNIHDIAEDKLLKFNMKYVICDNCKKYSAIKRWKDNKCPICHKVG